MDSAVELDETRRDILEEVSQMIREVIGEEWVAEQPITMDSSFSDDLEVESIEIVALAEKLTERYGDTVDFPGWLSEMELEDIINLTVGRVVDYVASCQSPSSDGS